MEKKMETTIMGYMGFRVKGPSSRQNMGYMGILI